MVSLQTLAAAPTLAQDLTAIHARLRDALALLSIRPEMAAGLLTVIRRDAASAIAQLEPSRTFGDEVAIARELVAGLRGSGAHDAALSPVDFELVNALRGQDWPGLLAIMALVPAPKWVDAPRLQDVPNWLLADFVGYAFQAPRWFAAPGDADAFARHTLRRLEELHQVARTNPDSAFVRDALAAFARTDNPQVLQVTDGSLRRQAELRGSLRALAAGRGAPEPLAAQSRQGRKLRIGIVRTELREDAGSREVVALLENLDRDRCDARLFLARPLAGPLEGYVAGRVAVAALVAGIEARVGQLRAAELDVLLLAENLAAGWSDVAELALHRVAALQVATRMSTATTGLPEIDLFLSGTECRHDDVAEFTERLGLIPGAGHSFSPDAPARVGGVAPLNRTELALGDSAVVLAACADAWEITPEVQQRWAQMLAKAPFARLILQPATTTAPALAAMRQVTTQWRAVLAEQGVPEQVVQVPALELPARSEAPLHAVADLWLTTRSTPAQTTMDALARCVPVVACEGAAARTRSATALLRSIALEELVAVDAADEVELVARLAQDAEARGTLRTRLADALARLPLFTDTLATADALVGLLEQAHDQLVREGRDALGSATTPLRVEPVLDVAGCVQRALAHVQARQEPAAIRELWQLLAAQPTLPLARHIMGAALLRLERPNRAVAYLIAAVQHDEGNPGLWHDLAIALRRSGQTGPALQALQTSLQLDPNQTDRQQMLRTWVAEQMDSAKLHRS